MFRLLCNDSMNDRSGFTEAVPASFPKADRTGYQQLSSRVLFIPMSLRGRTCYLNEYIYELGKLRFMRTTRQPSGSSNVTPSCSQYGLSGGTDG